jgi:ribosomal protein S27E
MINRDPRCVFVADSLGLAEVVALWLTHQEVPAQVMDRNTLGGLEGLTFSRTMVSSRGIEVWVMDVAQAPRASQLLEAHGAELAARAAARAPASGPIDVVCDKCGQLSTFPGSASGKVENCTHCGEYVDVPGGDDWDEADFEGGEDAGDV